MKENQAQEGKILMNEGPAVDQTAGCVHSAVRRWTLKSTNSEVKKIVAPVLTKQSDGNGRQMFGKNLL